MSTIILSNRNIRQKDLVPEEALRDKRVTVIGVGAIGRQVAIQLAAIGVPEIQLIDFDTVEEENLAAQGFMETDIGSKKVDAVRNICHQMNSEIIINKQHGKFKNLWFTGGVIFCCVDSIDVRKEIFEQVCSRTDLWIDGRMSAEFLRVLSVFDNVSFKYYQTQLFPSSEAHQGSCTAKSTIYCSNVAAGIMVSQFAKWLRKLPIDSSINLNLLTNEMEARA